MPGLALLILITVALGFEFINGFHDTANAIAVLIHTGALSAGRAVALAAVMNLLGAFASENVARTISGELISAAIDEYTIIAALIAAAYYIYCAALIITRRTSGQDIRPAVVGVSAFILAALRVNHRFEAGIIQRSIDFLYDYAFVAGAPFILAAIAGLIRFGRKGRAYEADK